MQVDVRVLAATNKDLMAEIRAGRFREDLYFRLNVIPIYVPPLRERPEDIPLLAEHFISDFAIEYGRRARTIDRGAMARLRSYRWPGNVREFGETSSSGSSSWRPATSITEHDLAFRPELRTAGPAVDDSRVRPRCRCMKARSA